MTHHQLYIRYFAHEFVVECKHICSVYNERSPRRSNITDKLLQFISLGSNLPGADPTSLGIKITAGGVSKIGAIAYNMYKIDELKKLVVAIIDVQEHVKNLAKTTAHCAAYQYEYAISRLIDEHSLYDFARCGVKRIFEYLIRDQLAFDQKHFLVGLIKGRTGAGIEGFLNARLTGQLNDRTFYAEDLYARAAARTADGLWANPNRQKLSLQQASIHVLVDNHDEPSAGYYWTSNEFIKELGYERFHPPVFLEELTQHKNFAQSVNETHFSDYMQTRKRGYWGSFNQFIGAIALFNGKLVNFDLSNCNFSNVDFSGAVFENCNFDHCNFKEAILVGTTFSGKTTAQWAHLGHACMYKAQMRRINFSFADFQYANTSLADFTFAIVTNIYGALSQTTIGKDYIDKGGQYPTGQSFFQKPFDQSLTIVETHFSQALTHYRIKSTPAKKIQYHQALYQLLGTSLKEINLAHFGSAQGVNEPPFTSLSHAFLVLGFGDNLQCVVLKEESADDSIIQMLWQKFEDRVSQFNQQHSTSIKIEKISLTQDIMTFAEIYSDKISPCYLGGNIELYSKAIDALQAKQTTTWLQLQHTMALWLEAVAHNDEGKATTLLTKIQSLYLSLNQYSQIQLMQQLESYPSTLFIPLAHSANSSGWHYYIQHHRAKWRNQLLNLTDGEIKDNPTDITWQTHDLQHEHNHAVVTYKLKPELVSQLLMPNGEFKQKPKNQAGRHWVLPLRDKDGNIIAWAKIFPESPGEEHSATRIISSAFGSGYCPETLIVKLHVPNRAKGQQNIAIQLSEHLPGETFDAAKTWQLRGEKPFRFDSLVVAWLSGLIFLPGDANPGNFLIENRNDSLFIRQFDLERIFFPAENEDGHAVQNLAWCLDEMQTPWPMIDPHLQRLIQRFLSLDIYAMLSDWIVNLKNEHAFYQLLFTDAEFKQHYQASKTLFSNNEIAQMVSSSSSWYSSDKTLDHCFLTLPLGADWLYAIAKRFSLLQIKIYAHVNEKISLTTLALQKQLHPQHHERYQYGFDKLKTTKQLTPMQFYPTTWTHLKKCAQSVFNTEPGDTPEEALALLRFHYLSHGEYTLTAAGSSVSVRGNKAQMLSKSLKLPQSFSDEMALQIRMGQNLSPAQADERLEQLERESGTSIVRILLNPQSNILPGQKTDLLDRFYRLPHLIRMELIKPILSNIEEEKKNGKEFAFRIVELMKGIPFTELDLRPFSDVLTDQALLELVTSDYAGEHLTKLSLAQCKKISNASIIALANHVPHLTHLDLSHSGMTHIICQTQAGFPSLMVLNLSNAESLQRILLYAPRLEKLDAQNCTQLLQLQVTTLIQNAIADLAGCVLLENKEIKRLLYFSSIDLSKISTKLKEALQNLLTSTTKPVVLHECSMNDADARYFFEALRLNTSAPDLTFFDVSISLTGIKYLTEALAANKHISGVSLYKNNIGPAGTRCLAEMLEINPYVYYLNLTKNNIGATGAQYIAEMLKANLVLSELNLGKNNIGETGAKHLADALKVNLVLSELNLEKNNIGTVGAQYIAAALTVNSSLSELNLRKNNIGTAGAKHIAEMLEDNCSLSTLNLCSNQIGDTGIEYIAEAIEDNYQLTEINVGDNKITEIGAKCLTEAVRLNYSLTAIEGLGFENNINEEQEIPVLIKRNCKLAEKLIIAVKMQQLNQVRSLIAKGVHPFSNFLLGKLGGKTTLLQIAVERRNIPLIHALLKHPYLDKNKKNQHIASAIQRARQLKYPECVAALVSETKILDSTDTISISLSLSSLIHMARSTLQITHQENSSTTSAETSVTNKTLPPSSELLIPPLVSRPPTLIATVGITQPSKALAILPNGKCIIVADKVIYYWQPHGLDVSPIIFGEAGNNPIPTVLSDGSFIIGSTLSFVYQSSTSAPLTENKNVSLPTDTVKLPPPPSFKLPPLPSTNATSALNHNSSNLELDEKLFWNNSDSDSDDGSDDDSLEIGVYQTKYNANFQHWRNNIVTNFPVHHQYDQIIAMAAFPDGSFLSVMAVFPDGAFLSVKVVEESIIQHWHWRDNGWHSLPSSVTIRGIISKLAILPDRSFMSGDLKGVIKHWRMQENQFICVATLTEHKSSINALSVFTDGNFMSGDSSGVIKHWCMQENQFICVATLAEHTDAITALALLPDESFVSGSKDKTIKHWQRQENTWICVATLNEQENSIVALGVLPDGSVMSISNSNDGMSSIKRWQFFNPGPLPEIMSERDRRLYTAKQLLQRDFLHPTHVPQLFPEDLTTLDISTTRITDMLLKAILLQCPQLAKIQAAYCIWLSKEAHGWIACRGTSGYTQAPSFLLHNTNNMALSVALKDDVIDKLEQEQGVSNKDSLEKSVVRTATTTTVVFFK